MRRISVTCAVILLMPAMALADKPIAAPVKIPFELLFTNHIAVNVKINGKGPYRVIFDTGAPITLLSNKAAKESGVKAEKGKQALFSPFGSMAQASINLLELGDLKADKVNTIIMDHPTVKLMSQYVGPLEGIVGFPFFARYRTTIDYQAKTMTFVPTGYEPPDVMQKMLSTVMNLADRNKTATTKILAPAGLWGMVLEKDKDSDKPGVVVREVYAGGAAAGVLKPGDRLLTLDSRWTDTVAEAFEAAGFAQPGKVATVTIERDGIEQKLLIEPKKGL